MSKLRICLVSYEFPPHGGGEGVYTKELMRALESNGDEVLLLTPSWQRRKSGSGGSVIYTEPLKIPGLKTASFMFRANRKLKKLSENFDIVHYTNDYCGYGRSRIELGKPVVATIHHTHSLEASSVEVHLDRGKLGRLKFAISEWLLGRLERHTLRNADVVVAVSRSTAENALAVYPFLKDKMEIVLNSVDDSRFNTHNDGVTYRKRSGFGESPVALYVGRLTVTKGIRFLVESFKEVILKVPDAKLAIAGSGSKYEEADIKSRIKALGLENCVIFLGQVSEEELPEVYAASDVVVLPSLVEGFGLVLLEGMAAGRPVVASRLGPIEEIVTDGEEGYLVPKGDAQALAKAISSILVDKNLRNKMGSAARKKVEEKFSKKVWATQMREIYQELSK